MVAIPLFSYFLHIYFTVRFILRFFSSELLALNIAPLIRELWCLFNHCVSQDNKVVGFQEAPLIVNLP